MARVKPGRGPFKVRVWVSDAENRKKNLRPRFWADFLEAESAWTELMASQQRSSGLPGVDEVDIPDVGKQVRVIKERRDQLRFGYKLSALDQEGVEVIGEIMCFLKDAPKAAKLEFEIQSNGILRNICFREGVSSVDELDARRRKAGGFFKVLSGDSLKEELRRRGWSGARIARRLRVSHQLVYLVLNGLQRSPRVERFLTSLFRGSPGHTVPHVIQQGMA